MKILLSLKQKLLRSTSYPSLDVDHVPELRRVSSSEEVSSDEESVARRRQLYRSKEDEDVAYFLEISRQLSLKSLIFLLQNHARNMHNITEAELNAVLERNKREEQEAETNQDAKLCIPKIKQFRFAQISNEKVRTVVHEIPRNDEVDNAEEEEGEDYSEEAASSNRILSLWWTQQEYAGIRLEAAQLVQFYRKHEKSYLDCVAVLANPEASPTAVETNMKSMMQNLNTRGLESHMASILSKPRKRTVRAVLQQQELCGGGSAAGAVPYNVSCECLRQASLEESASNLAFARRMGDYDHIEALKASLSRWRKPRTALPPL